MEIDKKSVGKRIKEIRLSLGLSMDKFGERIDSPPVKSGIISRWETGVSIPNPERVAKIADLGGIPVDELLHGNKTEQMLTAVHNAWASTLKENEMYYNDYSMRRHDYDRRISDFIAQVMEWKNIPEPSSPIYINRVSRIIQDEFERGTRNQRNMLIYAVDQIYNARSSIAEYLEDKQTQTAIKNGDLDPEVMEHLCQELDALTDYVESQEGYSDPNPEL